jgi:hypothetical protein
VDPVPVPEIKQPKPPILRLRVALIALGLAGIAGWLLFSGLADPYRADDPHAMSRADGRSRFIVTKYQVIVAPTNSRLGERLMVAWINFQKRHGKKNPTRWSFPASPVTPCSIDGLLNQCMEVTGTRYLVAVEIAGGVEFGHTNTLNGAQWVAAFENAIQTSSKAVLCYDYATKRSFGDSLLLIREKPGLVKVVPRSKLAAYQEAGLVDAHFKPEN